MASGARPSSNQRSESAPARKVRGHAHDHEHEYCVICGDRACNHRYYGVAACHGCKCFFWRSVKQKQTYKCRYSQNCDINPNYRNSCRYCRFQRCLAAGMRPDAVHMQTTKTIETKTETIKRPANSTTAFLDSTTVHSASDVDDSDSPLVKKTRDENKRLVESIIDLERRVNEEADFSENEAPKHLLSLDEIFLMPEFLECYRTRVHYCVRLRRATLEEMEFCKFRTLTKAYDYLNGFEIVGLGALTIEDKIKLLRSCYAPLTIFDITYGTTAATKDENLLCLPTGITLSRNEEIVSNSFMSQKLVTNIVTSLTRTLERLEMSETEASLLKAIILMNGEIHGLSSAASIAVGQMRDRLHGALYQNCNSDLESPTIRFAKLLHILPKMTLLARELVEHIRMVYTFHYEQKNLSPLFFQLFGDIFEEERESTNSAKTMGSGSSSRCDSATMQT